MMKTRTSSGLGTLCLLLLVTLTTVGAAAASRNPSSVGDRLGPGGPTAVTLPPVRRGAVVVCDQMAMVINGTYNQANGNAIGGSGSFGVTSDLQVADDCVHAAPLEITEVCQASVTFAGLAPADGLWVQVYADAAGTAAHEASFDVVATNVTTTPFVDNVFGLSGLILCAELPAGFAVPAGSWWWSLQPVSIGPSGDWYYQTRRTDVAPAGGDSHLRDGFDEHGTAFGGPYIGVWGTTTWVPAATLSAGAGDAAFRVVGNPVSATADLVVTKTDGLTSARVGDTVTYTIVVTNHGPDDAPDTQVIDLFPPALASASWTCSATAGSSCTSAGVGDLVDTADILTNGSVTYLARATIVSGGTGGLDNSASAVPGPDVQDPVPANDAATDTTEILAAPVLEVPTLSEVGLASLIVLLVSAALLMLGRPRRYQKES